MPVRPGVDRSSMTGECSTSARLGRLGTGSPIYPGGAADEAVQRMVSQPARCSSHYQYGLPGPCCSRRADQALPATIQRLSATTNLQLNPAPRTILPNPRSRRGRPKVNRRALRERGSVTGRSMRSRTVSCAELHGHFLATGKRPCCSSSSGAAPRTGRRGTPERL